MTTMYIYETTNSFPAPIVAIISGETEDACHALYMERYGINDYSYSLNTGSGDLCESADTEYLDA